MEICRGDVQIERIWFNNPSSPAPPLFHPGLHARKLVCVTSGNSNLGIRLAKLLLRRGYLVRVTVQRPDDVEGFKEREEVIRGLESLVVADMKNVESLRRAFRGCHAVFHTSSFIDPWGVSGYSEKMAALEAEGAQNVVEACSQAAGGRRCLLTSSMLASIWQRDPVQGMLDEQHWSDEQFCRENKLWLALGKTMAEKAAWRRSAQVKVQLCSICPALLTGPPPFTNSATIPYLKGGEVMLNRGVLATVNIDTALQAHICALEAMEHGRVGGRYLCFDALVRQEEGVLNVENMVLMMGGEVNLLQQQATMLQVCCKPSNAKLLQLLSSSSNSS